jgi:tetratricopeptide (TPR) repeat protein
VALLDAEGPDALAPHGELALALAAEGDLWLERVLEYLASLDDAGWERRRLGVEDYGTARLAVRAGRDAEAALARLEDGGDPQLAVKAAQYRLYAAISRGDRARAGRLVDALVDRCRSLGCREEAALVVGDRGTLLHGVWDFQGALAAFEEAERLLPPSALAGRAELLGKAGAVARDTGAPEEAARALELAARLQRSTGVPALATTLALRGQVLGTLGWTRAAEATLREAIELARENPDIRTEVRAVGTLAELVGADPRRRAEAIGWLEELAGRLPGDELASWRRAVLASWSTLLLADGRADEALPLARETTTLARRVGSAEALWAAVKVEADALRAVGDLEGAVAVLRDHPGDLAPSARPLDDLRLETRAAERWNQLALLRAETGDVEGALEALHGGAAPARPPPDECHRIAAPVGGLVVLATRTASGGRVDVLGPGAGADEPRAAGCPEAARQVWIERPGSLPATRLPWADRAAPGAWTAIARGPRPAWPEPWTGGRALAVIEPLVDPAEGLPALPGAAREAELLDAALGRAARLAGAAATPAAFRRAAPSADLIHLAAHGLARRGAGAASALVLAGEQGRLQVADVLALDLRSRRPIVVLTACGSAGGNDVEGDGAGLPWAFLKAGARAVVAHQGPLGDGAAVDFSRAFYGALGRGAPVGEAVARARAVVRAAHGDGAARAFLLYLPGGET